MRAVVRSEYGAPDLLRLKEVERPTPGHGEVLVRVAAASVNSWDWDLLRGKPLIVRMWGLRRPRVRILGCDVAGSVEAVGAGAKDFRPGDEVLGDVSGCGFGGFAEYVRAPEGVLARKSARLTFEEAAALPQAGVLALQGLRDADGRVCREKRILINGAGGGVGTFALQIARSVGAEVTCVDRAEKLEALRSLGAHDVIDYAREDFTRTGRRYDRILDVAAHRSAFDYARALNPGGRFVMVGGSMLRVLQVLLVRPWIALLAKKRLGVLVHRPNRKDLEALQGECDSGRVRPVIGQRYPLAEVAEALRALGEARALGKIVVTVA